MPVAGSDLSVSRWAESNLWKSGRNFALLSIDRKGRAGRSRRPRKPLVDAYDRVRGSFFGWKRWSGEIRAGKPRVNESADSRVGSQACLRMSPAAWRILAVRIRFTRCFESRNRDAPMVPQPIWPRVTRCRFRANGSIHGHDHLPHGSGDGGNQGGQKDRVFRGHAAHPGLQRSRTDSGCSQDDHGFSNPNVCSKNTHSFMPTLYHKPRPPVPEPSAQSHGISRTTIILCFKRPSVCARREDPVLSSAASAPTLAHRIEGLNFSDFEQSAPLTHRVSDPCLISHS